MRSLKVSAVLGICGLVAMLSGCVSEQQYKDLKVQNDTQQKRISELESEAQATKLQMEQLKRQLETATGQGNVEISTLQQKLAALEEDLAKKKSLIASMQKHLLGSVALPAELSTMLEDFAAKSQDMVSFDADRGIVKFKSDLLFEPGSDTVAPTAVEAVKRLCTILSSEQAKDFDIIIAGHTDDIRIAKAETRQKHPTNWHLSAHRAISVLDEMTKDGLSAERMSIRGFGEFRPAVPNEPNKKGNPQNRRVEIYIVAKGM